ncbi:hypothetical protein M231_04550 [Tremella mesenterica]|uniref:Autophagy-related protein n=1 Tax=Tremella mesenterica TaxID=5217 RepID=A0A4Q1BKG5_TREME|nr:hypothetical protein M231_04550 [Tremella mesenterica]
MAREIGYLAPDYITPCTLVDRPALETACKARILGIMVDTASFSMYVKSISVFIQALCIISVGSLADSPFWRKRLLVIFALTGSISAILLFLFPSSPNPSLPILAALLNILGSVTYSTTLVCSNAFLPSLAREDPVVRAAFKSLQSSDPSLPLETDDEEGNIIPPLLDDAVRAISTQDLASSDPAISPTTPTHPTSLPADISEEGRDIQTEDEQHAQALLSLTTSRISSTAYALGFLSGVSVLLLLTIPVLKLHGSTSALRLAIGISGLWWGIFTIPAWMGLPSGSRKGNGVGESSGGRLGWLGMGWRRVGDMIRPKEMRELRDLFVLLVAWIFLSDGFHTTTYTAILYASSTLRMSPAGIIAIGVLVQLSAIFSSLLAPKLQRRMGWSNLHFLLSVTVLGLVLPLYAVIGLVLPFGGLRTQGEMYVAAGWFGLLYGPFSSYSRAVYAELIPPNHESSFFSLFALTDKSASFIGPLVVGLIADTTGNIRLGFVFLLIMLSVPIPVLLRVNMSRGREDALQWSERQRIKVEERFNGERVGLLSE